VNSPVFDGEAELPRLDNVVWDRAHFDSQFKIMQPDAGFHLIACETTTACIDRRDDSR